MLCGALVSFSMPPETPYQQDRTETNNKSSPIYFIKLPDTIVFLNESAGQKNYRLGVGIGADQGSLDGRNRIVSSAGRQLADKCECAPDMRGHHRWASGNCMRAPKAWFSFIPIDQSRAIILFNKGAIIELALSLVDFWLCGRPQRATKPEHRPTAKDGEGALGNAVYVLFLPGKFQETKISASPEDFSCFPEYVYTPSGEPAFINHGATSTPHITGACFPFFEEGPPNPWRNTVVVSQHLVE